MFIIRVTWMLPMQKYESETIRVKTPSCQLFTLFLAADSAQKLSTETCSSVHEACAHPKAPEGQLCLGTEIQLSSVPHGNTITKGKQFLKPRANSELKCLLQHLGTSLDVPS